MGQRLAAIGMAGAIAVGGLTVAAVNPLSVAGATAGTVTTAAKPTPAKAKAIRAKAGAGVLKKALDKLVAEKKLTRTQADEVLAATKAEAKAEIKTRVEKRKTNRADLVGVVATAIGSTPDQVKAGIKGGTSIAAQAKGKGVDRQVVDDAVTKALTARIDAAVKAGKLKPARADRMKGNLDKAVDRILDADGSRIRNRTGN